MLLLPHVQRLSNGVPDSDGPRVVELQGVLEKQVRVGTPFPYTPNNLTA
jgi:hypothetical protein